MYNKTFENARNFVYRNARPIDFALWRYHFENGNAKDVYDILKTFQKSDGGFAYDIEPDCCNVNSTPIATWQAINILNEVGVERDSATVRGILEYLTCGKDYSCGKWFNTVKTNNDYPHAVWWGCNDGEGVPSDNPTVSLIGFVLKYLDCRSDFYSKAINIAKSAVCRFMAEPSDEPHVLRCYLDLFEYCESIDGFDLFDMNAFKSVLYEMINRSVSKQSNKWFSEYVTKPSTYFDGTLRIFDIVDKSLCELEGKLIIENQLTDGSYPVTWLWHNDFTEYYVAVNKWKSVICKNNMLFLRALKLL